MSLVRPSHTVTVTGLLTALLMLPGLLGTAAAQTLPNVLCGQVITSNTTLSGPVGPCEGDGLVIGASNITLDLNGHDVVGLEGTPQVTGTGAGILNDGHSNVTITDSVGGSEVKGFDGGVVLREGSDNTVSNLDIVGNVGGPVSQWGEGIGVWLSDDNTIEGNTVSGNGPYAGIGLYGDFVTDGSDDNLIRDNTVSNNNVARTPTVNENIGIRLEHLSKRNTVDDNTVSGNGLDGIAVFNTATDNTVSNNDVANNGNHDKTHRKGDGIRLWTGAVNNTVSGSTATGNAAVDLIDHHGDCNHNTWTGNTYGTKNPACIS